MKFSNDEFYGTGGINPKRWVSECGDYYIQQYNFKVKGMATVPTAPYFVGYGRKYGNNLTGDMVTLEECISALNEQRGELDD